MFKCADCGETFTECDYVTEDRGECWGMACSEQVPVCPCCGSDCFEEAVQCESCGEWFFYDETDCHFCKECKEEIRTEYESSAQKCYDLCKGEKESVELNPFLASMFDADEIETILLNQLLEREKPFWQDSPLRTDCSKFIEDDESWFFDRVEDNLERGEEE